MTRNLLLLCLGSTYPFADYVSLAIHELGDSFRVELADHFEVSEATVNHWAWDLAHPHPRLCKLVAEYIRKKAEESVSSGILDSAEAAHLAWADNPDETRTAPQMMADWVKSILKEPS